MPGLIRGVARTAVVAGTATAVSNRVSRRQGERWAAESPSSGGGYSAPPPEPAAPAGDDQIAQLNQLAQLRAQGALTDEEFAAAKRKLLGM